MSDSIFFVELIIRRFCLIVWRMISVAFNRGFQVLTAGSMGFRQRLSSFVRFPATLDFASFRFLGRPLACSNGVATHSIHCSLLFRFRMPSAPGLLLSRESCQPYCPRFSRRLDALQRFEANNALSFRPGATPAGSTTCLRFCTC